MIQRTLGRTGERVSAIGLGGFHLGLPKVDEALAMYAWHSRHHAAHIEQALRAVEPT